MKANNSVEVRILFNESRILDKVENDRFGKYTALEWKRLIDPYTPRDTGLLMQNVEIYPNEIHYKMPYAARVYYGHNMKFQHKNPYSTFEWDVAAVNAGQADKLTRTLNAAIISGQY